MSLRSSCARYQAHILSRVGHWLQPAQTGTPRCTLNFLWDRMCNCFGICCLIFFSFLQVYIPHPPVVQDPGPGRAPRSGGPRWGRGEPTVVGPRAAHHVHVPLSQSPGPGGGSPPHPGTGEQNTHTHTHTHTHTWLMVERQQKGNPTNHLLKVIFIITPVMLIQALFLSELRYEVSQYNKH